MGLFPRSASYEWLGMRRVHARCHGSIGAALLTSRRRKRREIHFLIFQKRLGFFPERRTVERFWSFFTFLHFSPSNRRRSVSSTRIGECRVNYPLDRSVLMSISGVLKLGFKLDFGGFASRVPNRHLGYILGKIEPYSCRLVGFWR